MSERSSARIMSVLDRSFDQYDDDSYSDGKTKAPKDKWTILAEGELLKAKNEEIKSRTQREQQKEWEQRIEEGKWLLAGVKTLHDSEMVTMIEEAKEKKKEEEKNRRRIFNRRHNISNEDDEDDDDDYIAKKEKRVRFRDPSIVLKEKVAKKLIELEENRNRQELIKKLKVDIKILKNVNQDLNVYRLPPHHCTINNLADYYEDTESTKVELDQRDFHLTGYHVQKPQPIIEKLRTNEEVLQEERKRRKFVVGGRYHNHLGSHRIYPLKCVPATQKPLQAKETKPIYPEDFLLPNYDELKKKMVEEQTMLAKERSAIYTLKKDALDMSRMAYRPTTAPTDDRPSDDRHISNRFTFRTKEFPLENSVDSISYDNQCSSKRYRNAGNTTVTNSIMKSQNDIFADSCIDSSVKYNIVEEFSAETAPMLEVQLSNTLSTLDSDHNGIDSLAAARSNYFSEGSIAGDKLIKLNLERHRNVRGLNRLRPKTTFGLVSRRRRLAELVDIRAKHMARLAIEDDLKQQVTSTG